MGGLNDSHPVPKPSTNEKLDRHLRQHVIRRALIFGVIAMVFIGFMSCALYVECGPGAKVADIFPELNVKKPLDR